MDAHELASTWQALGHKVLSSILVDHGAYFPVVDVLGRDSLWFPAGQDRVWFAIGQCVDDQTPPTVEAVTVRGQFGNGYVQTIANHWTNEDNRKVVYHAQELRKLGALADLRKAGRELQAVMLPDDVAGAIDYTTNRLAALGALSAGRKGDARTVSEEAYAQMDRFQGKHVTSGLPWFDKLIGGFWPGMNYWVVAAYKCGKSTLMRNFILHALEEGHAVDMYCAEGTRWLFALDCQAMIATRLLCEWGERELSKLRLSGLFILRSGRNKRGVYTEAEYKALAQAREIWEDEYKVWVWDTQDGIRDLTTLRYLVQKNAMEHGSQTHWFDYSQEFGIHGTTYEKQSRTTHVLEKLAVSEMITTGILSQRNEASINQGETHSAGVKGGGDAAAAADFMMIPEIDSGYMKVRIKHSRHTGVGHDRHLVNPSSGLIVDRWFAKAPAIF